MLTIKQVNHFITLVKKYEPLDISLCIHISNKDYDIINVKRDELSETLTEQLEYPRGLRFKGLKIFRESER